MIGGIMTKNGRNEVSNVSNQRNSNQRNSNQRIRNSMRNEFGTLDCTFTSCSKKSRQILP